MHKKNLIKIITTLCFIFLISSVVPSVRSDCSGNQATGLITVGQNSDNAISGTFGTTIGSASPCVLDPKAFLNPRERGVPVDSYEALKTLYFTKASSTNSSFNKVTLTCTSCNETNIPLDSTAGKDALYLVPTNLTINVGGSIAGINTQTGVIFVDGKLTINTNIISTANNKGLVFVTIDDVLIDKNVTAVDAVIISEGQICTASDENTCPDTLSDAGSTQQLLIKGGLVSINPAKPIKFRRNLVNNDINAAEKIIAQPKYLAILRDIFASPWQKWTELP